MAVGSSNAFDLVVLGAGTGGYTAAFRAAQLGLKVALVDGDKIGGTCLHRGCMPTKALLESAGLVERTKHAKDYGLVLGGDGTAAIDYAQMAARKDQVVKRMWTGLKTLIDKNKVTWIEGRGRLEGPTKIRVSQPGEDGTPGKGGDRVLEANDVILATGSRVKSLPGLTPDGERILTSDDVLRATRIPKDIVIVGAGAVGCEFASMYHDLGTKVTLLEYFPQIVPLEDREVSQALERSFSRRGITVMTNARFDSTKVEVTKDGVCLVVGPEGKEPAELRAEQLLVAAGRATNVEDVGLETTKIEVEKGFVKVDPRMRTREPHVYAIGDIVGGLMLAHTAAHEGIVAAHTIAGDKDTHPVDYVKQPRATYCRPEIASIGLTQQQAEERGHTVKIGKVPFQAIAKAIIGGEYEGFAKVIADKDTDETLGIHLIGPHATDLIAEASVAFELEAVPWEIGGATHAHPTLSEILGEAAMNVDGRSINF
jgi:dihydrolipoamide dehydrogenase